jgi:hypothetical protein
MIQTENIERAHAGIRQEPTRSESCTDELERLRTDNRELRAAIGDQCQRLAKENEVLRACLDGSLLRNPFDR